jgi:hypothetical protein
MKKVHRFDRVENPKSRPATHCGLSPRGLATTEKWAEVTCKRSQVASIENKGGEPSVRVKKGKFQVVQVDYEPNGESTITPISEWLLIKQPINGIPTSKELVAGTIYESLFTTSTETKSAATE